MDKLGVLQRIRIAFSLEGRAAVSSLLHRCCVERSAYNNLPGRSAFIVAPKPPPQQQQLITTLLFPQVNLLHYTFARQIWRYKLLPARSHSGHNLQLSPVNQAATRATDKLITYTRALLASGTIKTRVLWPTQFLQLGATVHAATRLLTKSRAT